jgi:signal transduction histidine kinase
LWFPNYRALAGFDPAVVRESGRTLAPLIEEVSADGVLLPRDPAMGLRVRSGVRRIEFHYACADLRAPERLRFQYKLDGVDDGWSTPGAQRTATYGPLAPGNYLFHVKAGGASIEWHEAAEALPLIVVPRWWERTLVRIAAVILCVLLTGGTVWLVARARHRRKLARLQLQQVREMERRRIARDIHDDLGATLARVVWLGEMSGTPEAAQSHMRKVATAAREMSQSLEGIVWAVRPENDTLRSLVAYLGRRMDELFEGTNTAYRFVAPRELPERMVFAEARHNVFLACKEALTNALKHSRAGTVRLELDCVGDECHVTITDDGMGFDPQGTRRADAAGLKNMRSRMEEIKGGFDLRSEPGKGTTVRLRFPIPPSRTD